MLTNVGFLSYLANGVGYLILAILLIVSWRGRIVGGMLLFAVLVQVLWSGVLAFDSYSHFFSSHNIFVFEIIRFFAWSLFMLRLLGAGKNWHTLNYVNIIFYIFTILIIAAALFGQNIFSWVSFNFSVNLQILVLLVFSIVALVLTEQVYRNVQVEKRWAVKFLCIGLGVLFAYDLFIYSDALLFDEVEQSFWDSRGIINALAIPLIALSAKRNPKWSFDIFVSRHVVFYSTGIVAVGIYLILMSFGGYYIKIYGGSWGGMAQTVFIAGAGIVLFVVLSSGATRAKLKVFLTKHFYENKYDYREEWLRLIHNISDYKSARHFKDQIIQTVAGIMQCRGGVLFLKGTEDYECVSTWNCIEPEQKVLLDSSLVRFLNKYEWIIDITEYKTDHEHYKNLDIPDWVLEMQSAWLIVPLKHDYNLIGFFILLESGINKHTNWEDRDLLKAVGRQVSSYLAFIQASEALNQAEQFDAFNRLSAYVVHDLKNLVSQLELIAKNAEVHKDNPEFIADSFLTVSNVVVKMQKMLGQLKKMHFAKLDSRMINVAEALMEVANRRSSQLPEPELEIIDSELKIYVEPERFSNIIEHLIQNAQEATADDGYVKVRLFSDDGFVIISVEDNGSGMTNAFIRDRLFRPFDTTKGNAGMGIGVYEVNEFVKSYNGYVNVESAVGVGSVFTVKLPVGSVGVAE